MKTKIITLLLAASLTLSLLAGCGQTNTGAPQTTSPAASSSNNYDGKLELDRSMELKYAKNFKVDYYKGGYKMLTVTNRTADVLEGYISKETKLLLVPENMSVPSGLDKSVIVLNSPVNNLLVSSSGAVSQFNAIGALDRVTMCTTEYSDWYIDEIKAAMDAKTMAYVGAYKSPDYEQITKNAPKLSISTTMLTGLPEVVQKLSSLGVSIMLDESAYEDHPLGRIEWMKFYGALTGKEDEANRVFAEQVSLVDKISAKQQTGKSVAIFYITSNGKLYVRNAGDYLVEMVEMAGLKYACADIGVGKTGTTSIEMEAFYKIAANADYLIYIWSLGGKPSGISDLIAKYAVLSDFKATKEGNVWTTSPAFYQINDKFGTVISDMREMVDSKSHKLNYIYKMK